MLVGPVRQILARTIHVGIPPYFLAFGVTVGGGLFGALGRWLVADYSATPAQTAFQLRIWAVAIAIGGTLTALESFERSVSTRALPILFRDGLALLLAYWGAQSGYVLLKWWAGA